MEKENYKLSKRVMTTQHRSLICNCEIGETFHLPKLPLESVLLKGSSAYYQENTEINQ